MNKGSTSPEQAESNTKEISRTRKRSRRATLLNGAALAVLILGFVGTGTFIATNHYTAQPTFCGSCHIMDPYYESWQADVHGRAGGLAACVDCHYAPGEKNTIMAKFRGLSQATSYFSGRYGASRPRAFIDNMSCLAGGCHGNMEFMEKDIWITKSAPGGTPHTKPASFESAKTAPARPPTVKYIHAKHLQPDSARESERLARREELSTRLKDKLTPEAFDKIEAMAKGMGMAEDRHRDIREFLGKVSPQQTDEAIEYADLEHKLLRTAQLHNLTCSSCHTFDDSGARHISVARTSCFTCHFANQPFNTGTGECLLCHTPPSGDIAIHGSGEGGAVMDHAAFVKQGVNCVSCHVDLVRGIGEVTRRDCTHCHDKETYLEEFDNRTTETVKHYHETHTFDQHAKCTDCHRAIQHHLIRTGPEETENFFQPVLDDCQHCHPKHHKEQVQLLMGIGGYGVEKPLPNPMFGSRVSCRACHTESGNDFKGDELVKATKKNCVACHSDTYEDLYDEWLSQLRTRFSEVEAIAKEARALAEKPPSEQALKTSEAKKLLARAQANMKLVQAAHGIHNRSYALELLDQAARDFRKAVLLMKPTTKSP